MPIHLSTLIEGRLLCAEFSGDVTISDVRVLNLNLLSALETATAPLYVFADVTMVANYPHIASDLWRYLTCLKHPRFASGFVYGVRFPAIIIILRIMAEFLHFNYAVVPSLADALTALAQCEPALQCDIATVRSRHAIPLSR